MTRFCDPLPELVGPTHWLPPESFEFGWAYGVGCNSLRCERCNQPVRAEVRAAHRHYECGCQHRDETDVYRIGAETMDLYPIAHFPAFTEWVCGGHSDLVLPASLDGIQLDGRTDWTALVAGAVTHPPFEPPGVDANPAWLLRLYQLLGAERALLSEAVAGLLSDANPLLVRAAYDFFSAERDAAGADRVAVSVSTRKEWLAATPNPLQPASALLDHVTTVLHDRLLLDDETGLPIDGPALDVAKDLVLTGIGPADAPFSLHDCDPEWVWTHAAALSSANSEWVDALVYLLLEEDPPRRDRTVRSIAEVTYEPLSTAIETHFEGPERDRLISLAGERVRRSR
jgi:hypothetical protein